MTIMYKFAENNARGNSLFLALLHLFGGHLRFIAQCVDLTQL
jgi:hypothetical protein